MAAGKEASTTRSLEETPTWAVATVCFLFVFLSLLIEYFIHLTSNWLKRRKKTALFDAVEKLKSVLMVLGFMSLMLTVSRGSISRICLPNNLANTMLPCHKKPESIKTTQDFVYQQIYGRILADGVVDDKSKSSKSDYCESKGKTSLISEEGGSQLSIFIFVLAATQILYTLLTMALGRAKMRRWKVWEKETQTVEYQLSNDPNRFRFTRQTTFARRHLNSCAEASILLWTKCFFQQFFNSVAKVDYLTLRHGFISAHLSTNTSFNFQKYIQRSLDDDFKVVVGISPFMWFLVVIFLLVDVHGWNVYLWVSFLPLTIVLILGTKLQVILAQMAHRVKDQNSVIQGSPLVQPNDDFFWFSRPDYVLTLLHYTLFMNAFEAAFFVWVTIQYGIKSCYHENRAIIVTRVVLAVSVQVICSYITLPLYALVTQMGSKFKRAVLEEQTANAIKQWHADVKQKRKNPRQFSPVSPEDSSNNRTSMSVVDASSHQPRTLASSENDSFREIQEEVGPVIDTDIQMTSMSVTRH